MAVTPRLIQTQQVHFLRKTVGFANRAQSLSVGAIPAGSVLLYPACGIHVSVAFNGTGADTMNIGTSGTANLFASAVDISSVGFKAIDENIAGLLVSSDTEIFAAYTDANSDATTGSAEVLIAYIPDTDG